MKELAESFKNIRRFPSHRQVKVYDGWRGLKIHQPQQRQPGEKRRFSHGVEIIIQGKYILLGARVRFLWREILNRWRGYVSLTELPLRYGGSLSLSLSLFLYAKNFAIFRLRGDRRAMAGK